MKSDGATLHHPLRGIVLIMSAVSIFAVMDTTAKYLSRDYPVPLIVWSRYAFQTLLMLIVLGPRLRLGLVRSRRPGMQIVRGGVLTLSTILFFNALALMPVAEASALSFVSPLFVMVLSVFALRERVAPAGWLAVAAGFAGVLLIIRPGGGVFSLVALLPISTALCFATYQILTRRLAGVDATFTTLFYPGIVGTVVMSAMLPFAWRMPQSLFHAALFVMLGTLGGVSHFILIRAFDHAPASTLAPFVYVQLVAMTFFGYLVFGDFPDGLALTGMTVIVGSGVFIALYRNR